jgi:hypothetical protein
MKYVKVLSVALGLAGVLVALAGVGTASATFTTLCKVEILVCNNAELQYPANTNIAASVEEGTKISVNIGITKFTCSKGTFKATTLEQTEMPLPALVTGLTVEGCNECTVTLLKKGELDIELIDIPVLTKNGTLTLKNTEIGVNCLGVIECFYAPGDVGVLTGGNPATIDLSGTLVKLPGSNFACGKATVSGSLTVTSPKPVWVDE